MEENREYISPENPQEREEREEFIQVGFTALRGPDGSFLPAVPLYIRATDEAIAGEEKFIRDIGKLFAHRMKAYRSACSAEGVSI